MNRIWSLTANSEDFEKYGGHDGSYPAAIVDVLRKCLFASADFVEKIQDELAVHIYDNDSKQAGESEWFKLPVSWKAGRVLSNFGEGVDEDCDEQGH